jgi:beta-lactamase class A
VTDAPPLPPPAIEQPAPYQASYGLVTGTAPPGTRRIAVSVNGRAVGSSPLRGRRFTIWLRLPAGDATIRVSTRAGDGRTSSAAVRNVLGLPAASRPRLVAGRNDGVLERKVRALGRGFGGAAGIYARSLTGGTGAAWNAKARFPAASTLKLAVAAAVLASYHGIPPPGSSVNELLVATLTRSDNAAANALEVWLAGSTGAASSRIDALMSSIGMRDSEMYGGYELRTLSGSIPVTTQEQPAWGYGKYTTAADMSTLLRAVWLASGGLGPLRREQPGFTPADGRHLLWLLAHVQDVAKLDDVEKGNPGVLVLHKAGWIDSARHDAGLVFWPGGVFVAAVMTWSPRGAGVSADVLAGRVAAWTLARLRKREG